MTLSQFLPKVRHLKSKTVMKITLSTSEIADHLKNDSNANWSYAGSRALAEWLEEMDESCGTDTELDVVAIRCDFSEWSSLAEWAADYFGAEEQAKGELGVEDALWECEDEIRNYINSQGTLIEFSGGVIVSSF